MPACVTIFDKKCKPLMELGEGPYNTLRWNPKGRSTVLFLIPMFFYLFFFCFIFELSICVCAYLVTYNRFYSFMCGWIR